MEKGPSRRPSFGSGDTNTERVNGDGWSATVEATDRSWWAIEFDVSKDVCIYEMYIGCRFQTHKSGHNRYQMWTASKIDKEGVDKFGASWYRGNDDCYHIGWFKVREDFMDWV